MAKRNKKQQQSNRYSLLDCEIRPVTKSDKWCQRKMPKGQIPVGDAPWGYVVTIPYCPNENTFLDNVDGYIVRTKSTVAICFCRSSRKAMHQSTV